MAKVTMREGAAAGSPSEQIVKAANPAITITDSLGRSIVINRPKPLDNLDFSKAAGGDKLNLLYLAEVAHLKFVREIDGDRVSTPSNELQLRALYQLLGDEGNAAVQAAVAEHYFSKGAEADAELKNS